MNRIKDPTKVPNAGSYGVGFIYKDRDSGKIFVHAVVEQVIFMARKHRAANNYPVGPDFNQAVIESICSNQPDLCWDEPPPTAGERVRSVGKALMNSARSGFATLTSEEVEQREAVCASCEHYSGQKGLFQVMCGKCGCLRLKIHLKTSLCPLNKWPDL